MDIELKTKDIVYKLGCDSPQKIEFLKQEISSIVKEVEEECAKKYAAEINEREATEGALFRMGRDVVLET